MKLTAKQCELVKANGKTQKLSDGGGLYLEVSPKGSKYWRMKYRYDGKEKRLAFGTFPLIGLKDARLKRDEAKRTLDAGLDPSEEKKRVKRERIQAKENDFEKIAREWHAYKKHTWKPVHAERILHRLEKDVFPAIGNRPIREIMPPELLEAIRKVEKRGTLDLAHRLMQSCSQVFRYAVASGFADRDITADLKGALKPKTTTNLAHLSEQDFPRFLKTLKRYDSQFSGNLLTKLAFQLMILTFVRTGEIRGAKWEEIDWEKKQWRIPEERMKMKEQHIVPLCKQSITILREVEKLTGDSYSGYIFPSQQNPRKTMSENTFLRAIQLMGYKGKTTGHGFRSTASTILNENGFRPDVIERQLAHAERNQIRAAYNHAEYLKERIEMMRWWGDYVESKS